MNRHIRFPLLLSLVALFVIPPGLSLAEAIDSSWYEGGRVALLLSFGGPEDRDAEDFGRAFSFMASQGMHPFEYTIANVSSPYGAVVGARNLMTEDSVLLVAIAGDEGSSLAVALMSKEHEVPMLKLTSDPRSFTHLSGYVFELLPSREAQAEELARYCYKQLNCTAAAVVAPDMDTGWAMSDGFRHSFELMKPQGVTEELYRAGAVNIKRELANALAHLNTGEGDEDLTYLFTDSLDSEGETSAQSGARPGTDVAVKNALFVVLSSDQIDAYSGQIRNLDRSTILCGNSGWLHPEALVRQSRITEGMYIVSPLALTASVDDTIAAEYLATREGDLNEWELLGLDAAAYIGWVMSHEPRRRNDVVETMSSLPIFEGYSIRVDFRYGRENREARIQRYESGQPLVIR